MPVLYFVGWVKLVRLSFLRKYISKSTSTGIEQGGNQSDLLTFCGLEVFLGSVCKEKAAGDALRH